MTSWSTRFAGSLAGLLAVSVLLPAAAMAGDAPAPRYTYLGAAYEWGESKCGFYDAATNLRGYSVEGSVGVFDWAHLIGAYYDGESTGGVPTGGDGVTTPAYSGKLDGKCYELGAGLNYRFAPGADLVLRGSWVHVDFSDDAKYTDISDDGFEPELGVRYAFSDKTEVDLSMAYYDVGDLSNTEIRLNLFYHALPWLSVRAGGSVFDSDTSFILGLRATFGGNLF